MDERVSSEKGVQQVQMKVSASYVMPVHAPVVGNRLRDIASITEYGVPSVISCCVNENTIRSDSVGAVRRCTLQLHGYEECLLRERLESSHTSGMQTIFTLTYVPCSLDEQARCPFRRCQMTAQDAQAGCSIKDMSSYDSTRSCDDRVNNKLDKDDAVVYLSHANTEYRVSPISNFMNRCYVELNTTLEFVHDASSARACGFSSATCRRGKTGSKGRVECDGFRSPSRAHAEGASGGGDCVDIGGAAQTRVVQWERNATVQRVTDFWQRYLNSLLCAVEAKLFRDAYPVLEGRIDFEFRQTYEDIENVYCQWMASSRSEADKRAQDENNSTTTTTKRDDNVATEMQTMMRDCKSSHHHCSNSAISRAPKEDVLPRYDVLAVMERALSSWADVLHEYRQQRLVAATATADLVGARCIADASARELAEQHAGEAERVMRRRGKTVHGLSKNTKQELRLVSPTNRACDSHRTKDNMSNRSLCSSDDSDGTSEVNASSDRRMSSQVLYRLCTCAAALGLGDDSQCRHDLHMCQNDGTQRQGNNSSINTSGSFSDVLNESDSLQAKRGVARVCKAESLSNAARGQEDLSAITSTFTNSSAIVNVPPATDGLPSIFDPNTAQQCAIEKLIHCLFDEDRSSAVKELHLKTSTSGCRSSYTQGRDVAPAQSRAGFPTDVKNVGDFNTRVARALFDLLDADHTDAVGIPAMKGLVLLMHSCGLYEEGVGYMHKKDRLPHTNESAHNDDDIALMRFHYQRCTPCACSVCRSTRTDSTDSQTLPCADTHTVDACFSDSSKVMRSAIARINAAQAARKHISLVSLAESVVNMFAFHKHGQLNFDEFCLALLHLCTDPCT